MSPCDDCRDSDSPPFWDCGWPTEPCKCECHESGYDDGLLDDDDAGPCMGAECCNPAIDHRYGECVTREMMEAICGEARR